jgi:hypothetical protein
MNQNVLDRDQLDRLGKLLFPTANLLIRPLRRMAEAGFPGNDPLHLLAREAQSIMQHLRMHMNYLDADRRKRNENAKTED